MHNIMSHRLKGLKNKYFATFPRHIGSALNSEYFALNLWISTLLMNK